MNPLQNKQKFDDFEGRNAAFDKNVAADSPSSPTLALRTLKPGDAAALRGLRHRAIAECAWNFGTPPAVEQARGTPYYRRQLFTARFQSSSRYLGLWRDEALVGMAGLRLRRTRGTPFGLIFSMYLVPELRGQDLGRALLRAAQDRTVRLWHPPRLRMNVEVRNQPALKLYQSEGFHILRTDQAAFRIAGVTYDVFLLEKPLSDP